MTLKDNEKLIDDQKELSVKNKVISQFMKEFEDSKSSDRSAQLYKKTYQQLTDELEE